MCGGSLHHQLEGCIRLDILQVVFPQDGARLAVNAKKLDQEGENVLFVT